MPVETALDSDGLPRPEVVALHFAGKTPRARLEYLAQSENVTERIQAALDPKLPPPFRKALVEEFFTVSTDGLGASLLRNPMLSEDEIDYLLSKYLVSLSDIEKNRADLALVYEHPNCGERRKRELLRTPRREDLHRETPVSRCFGYEAEAITVGFAAMHLSLTDTEVNSLARRWFKSVEVLSDQHSSTYVDDWKNELDIAAARLCTHPRLSPKKRSSVLCQNMEINGDRAPEKMLCEWAKFGNRPPESDLEVLEAASRTLTEEEERILWTAIISMPHTKHHPDQSRILRKGWEVYLRRGGPGEKNDRTGLRAIELLKKDPEILARTTWTRKEVKEHLASKDRILRQLGLHGVEYLALHRASHPEEADTTDSQTTKDKGRDIQLCLFDQPHITKKDAEPTQASRVR